MKNIEKFITGLGITVAIVFGAIGMGLFSGGEVPTQDGFFAGQRAGLQEFVNGITLGNKDSRAGSQVEWYSGKFAPGQDQKVVMTNTSGKDMYADFGAVNVITGETASSTTLVSMFSTTTKSIVDSQDFNSLTEGKRALIQSVQIATSTTATTTNSTYAAAVDLGNGAIVIPTGSSLLVYLQQDITNADIACAAAGLCETATSTNRGFNPTYKVRVHY